MWFELIILNKKVYYYLKLFNRLDSIVSLRINPFHSTEIKAAAQKQHLFLYFFFTTDFKTHFDSFIQK